MFSECIVYLIFLCLSGKVEIQRGWNPLWGQFLFYQVPQPIIIFDAFSLQRKNGVGEKTVIKIDPPGNVKGLQN
jgi:hypothetical protein